MLYFILINTVIPLDKMGSSPTYKNLKLKKIQSPVQLKEKIRKDYKNNVRTCRDLLLNRLRGTPERDIRTTLNDIYNKTFNNFNKEGFQIELLSDAEEAKILEEIKEELIQNEIDWWLEEYEKSQSDNIDWNTMQGDENVICMICQKNNFILNNKILSCTFCKINIHTDMSLVNIKRHTYDVIEHHNTVCGKNVQFTVVSETGNTHNIYFICEECTDMQLIV